MDLISLSNFCNKGNKQQILDECLTQENMLNLLQFLNARLNVLDLQVYLIDVIYFISKNIYGKYMILFSKYQTNLTKDENTSLNLELLISLFKNSNFEKKNDKKSLGKILSIVLNLIYDHKTKNKSSQLVIQQICKLFGLHKTEFIKQINLYYQIFTNSNEGVIANKCQLILNAFKQDLCQNTQDFQQLAEISFNHDFNLKLEKVNKYITRFIKHNTQTSYIKQLETQEIFPNPNLAYEQIIQSIAINIDNSLKQLYYNDNVNFKIRNPQMISIEIIGFLVFFNTTNIITSQKLKIQKFQMALRLNLFQDVIPLKINFKTYRQAFQIMRKIRILSMNQKTFLAFFQIIEWYSFKQKKQHYNDILSTVYQSTTKSKFHIKNTQQYKFNGLIIPDTFISLQNLKLNEKKEQGVYQNYQGQINLQTDFKFQIIPYKYLVKQEEFMQQQIGWQQKRDPLKIQKQSDFQQFHVFSQPIQSLDLKSNLMIGQQYQQKIGYFNQQHVNPVLNINLQGQNPNFSNQMMNQNIQQKDNQQIQNYNYQVPQVKYIKQNFLAQNAQIQQLNYQMPQATQNMHQLQQIAIKKQQNIPLATQQPVNLMQKMKAALVQSDALAQEDHNLIQYVNKLRTSNDPKKLEKIQKIMQENLIVRKYFLSIKKSEKK